MTLSWKELVCHGLLVEFGEPSLVKILLNMAMKERMDFLEKEAREFHSENMAPILNYFCLKRMRFKNGSNDVHYAKARDALCSSHLFLGRVIDQLNASWEERRPSSRRTTIFCVLSGKWAEMFPDYPILPVEDYVQKRNWYMNIHEGRYFLFWHKDSFRQATKYTHWSCVASIDINIVEGRTLENPWGNQAWPDICWDPKYLREGGKEKKHIDDMFIKE